MTSVEQIAAHPALAEAEILRLRGLLQQRWQPIETAPKQELHRDGENSYSEYVLGWYPGLYAPIRMRWWQHGSYQSNFIADGGYAVFPTHWMKLPEPPNGKN